jgi:hypothetical protein
MANQPKSTSKNPDAVKFSEITKILEEEGLTSPEVLSPENTFGQARGIAGRKRTRVMKRLGELGFIEAHPGGPGVGAKGTVKIVCHVLVIGGIPIIYCSVEIEMKTE